MKFIKTALAAAAFAVMAGAASAATVFNISGFGDDGTPLSATISFDLIASDLTNGLYTYDVSVTNTSNAIGSNEIRAFTIDTTPNSTIHSVLGTTNFTPVTSNAGVLDFCLEVDANNNCNGNATGNGVGEGQTDSFQIVLSASGVPVFDYGIVRFQAVGLGDLSSGKIEGGPCDPSQQLCGPPVTNVPLPASLPLLLAGLGVTGYVARRKQKAA